MRTIMSIMIGCVSLFLSVEQASAGRLGDRLVEVETCVSIYSSKEAAEEELAYKAMKLIARKVLTYIEIRDVVSEKSIDSVNFEVANDSVYSRKLVEYIEVLSAGYLQNNTFSFFKKSSSSYCCQATAIVNMADFIEAINEIKNNENNLPEPVIVRRFHELPDYFRVSQ